MRAAEAARPRPLFQAKGGFRATQETTKLRPWSESIVPPSNNVITSFLSTLIGQPHFGAEGPRNASIVVPSRMWVGRLGTRLADGELQLICILAFSRHNFSTEGFFETPHILIQEKPKRNP